MIDRIQSHNTLNGFRFSVAEFALVILIVFPFGLYYFLHQKLALALIALGLICNFSMMIIFGVRSILRKEKGGNQKDLFNKIKREEIDRKHPKLLTDTLLLVITLLLPFLLFVSVTIELTWFHKNKADKQGTQRD